MNSDIVHFLLANGYWMMFLLMWLEGPVVTLSAAFLASLGFFSWPMVLLISMLGDITGDMVLYSAGRKWGYTFVNRFGKYLGIRVAMIEKMQHFFHVHGGKIIFMVKSTTGLCFVTFVAAGIARMPFRKFIGYSLLGGVIWSGMLVAAGYFFGYLYEEIARYISWAGWGIAFLVITFFVGVTLYKKYEARRLFGNGRRGILEKSV